MSRKFVCCLVAVVATLGVLKTHGEELSAAKVRKAIKRGRDYLIAQQSKAKGNWPEYAGQPGGVTSLCTLALLNSGLEPDDPIIKRALDYLRGLEPKMTYSTALQTMVFCAAGQDRDRPTIAANVRWLEATQITGRSHNRRGAWAYSGERGNGDNSNAQFALLALHEAHKIGIPVSESTWQLALDYWLKCQKDDGSWGYLEDHPSTGSMTCAGISSLIISMENLPKFKRDAIVVGDRVDCCGKHESMNKLELAMIWLGEKFSTSGNPGPAGFGPGRVSRSHLLYYLYGVERVGRLSGRRFIGTHDWYREVCKYLTSGDKQDSLTGHFVGIGHAENDPRISTALALLFLSKGRWPVLMAKYKYTEDNEWNLHRRGVHNLTQSIERRWKQRLTWQTIEGRVATVNDLMETPVLFISGRNGFSPTPEQKGNLREYVNQGGFIFAEACHGDGCDGAAFDKQFRAVMEELFSASSWRKLPFEHPIWHAERKVIPSIDDRFLWGLDACCRTSVVYCPSNLSCYWELHRDGRGMSKYPAKVEKAIDECVAIGQNVLAYATNREVKAKLERPKVIISDPALSGRTRGMLSIPKLGHNGGSNDAPNALANLLNVARDQFDMKDRINPTSRVISPDDPDLYKHPILFVHGRREFRFTAAQRKALATYIDRGGFIFGDAICASTNFAASFRAELKAMFPDGKIERIPIDHPLFSQDFRGYDLKFVTLRLPATGGGSEPLRAKLTKTEPLLEGLKIDGRLAVVFSPYDISCAMENHASLECKGYTKADAAKIGLNIILYALQQ